MYNCNDIKVRQVCSCDECGKMMHCDDCSKREKLRVQTPDCQICGERDCFSDVYRCNKCGKMMCWNCDQHGKCC